MIALYQVKTWVRILYYKNDIFILLYILSYSKCFCFESQVLVTQWNLSFVIYFIILYTCFRLVRNHSDSIRELSKRNTDENKELNEYTSFAQSNESHILHHEIKDDNSSTVYSQVERKRQNGQLSSEYDHINYKGSAKSMNSNIDNEPDNYSHLRPYNNPERGYGQYDRVELGNIENNSQTFTRPVVLETSIEPPSDSEQGQQYINPYVDEAVIKGMVIDNELRRSLASSMDFDESIRDMMTHATSWAEEESSGF